MIRQRICQLWVAIRAAINENDQAFLRKYLSVPERLLFFTMTVPEQRHALNVAYTALYLAGQEKEQIQKDLLIRVSLLHDVGKICGDTRIFNKIMTVLADYFCPNLARRWARQGKGTFRQNICHVFYVYYHHAELSQEKLLALGLDELAEIVAAHHKAPAKEDSPELSLLRKADDMN